MKTFLLEIIPKIQKYSQKLDDITLLTNQHWVLMDSIGANKTIYIFRLNKELLVSTNGKVTKGQWDYLGNNSILIDLSDKSFLFKHGFFDKNVLALKSDNSYEYTVLVNENQFDGELNSINKLIEFLELKYLKKNSSKIAINKKQNQKSLKSKKGKYSETKKTIYRKLALFLIFFSMFIMVNYVISDLEAIQFHIFNDLSMCPCTPEITQANPIENLIALSIVLIIGVIGFIRNN